MRADEYCNAQMAQRVASQASFGFSHSTHPGYKNKKREKSLHITAEAESTFGGDLAGKYSH